MHELSQNSAKEICAENISANCETFKCELCDKEANSEPELKVHKAKWHTNVAPYYRNITRLLAYREMFSEECIICRKQFDNRAKHIKEEHDFIIDEEVFKRGIFNNYIKKIILKFRFIFKKLLFTTIIIQDIVSCIVHS